MLIEDFLSNMDIWQQYKDKNVIKKMTCQGWRIVENQNQTATRKLVDSLQEQIILEEIIETHKPSLPNFCQSYHYLLATPFRYPPLKYGSRFGARYETSLWYGSLSIETALAEKAYYRFHLLRASDAEFAEFPIKYSAFIAEVETLNGVDLTDEPFSNFTEIISRPDSYEASQRLGTRMRAAGVDAFYYISARCLQQGSNIALFVPRAFKKKDPIEPYQIWQGIITNQKKQIEFIRMNGLKVESKQFTLEQFMVNGIFPNPAT